MRQVCLRFLLCKKATIPLTNPYDPVAARFYIVLYSIAVYAIRVGITRLSLYCLTLDNTVTVEATVLRVTSTISVSVHSHG